MRSSLHFEPINAGIGAVVHGLAWSIPFSQEVSDQILEGLLAHQVLVFPDANLSPEIQIALAECIGPVWTRHPFFPSVKGARPVAVIEDGPTSPPENAVWHSDMSPSNPPPFGSVLSACTIPQAGGDTLWCSMRALYDQLPPALRSTLRGRVAVHSLDHGYRDNLDNGKLDTRAEVLRNTASKQRLSRHPVIMSHPVTGQALVYVNRTFTSHIEGFLPEDSTSTLEHIYSMIENSALKMRVCWRPGMVVMYDNFATQHYAMADHFPARRQMNRVTIGSCRRISL